MDRDRVIDLDRASIRLHSGIRFFRFPVSDMAGDDPHADIGFLTSRLAGVRSRENIGSLPYI